MTNIWVDQRDQATKPRLAASKPAAGHIENRILASVKSLPPTTRLSRKELDMRIIWVSLLLGTAFLSTAFAQRDAPVWEAYLPQVSVYHANNNQHDALAVDFLFKKNGGPYQHTQHQAYILIYLKKDEEQILKLAADEQLVRKRNEKAKQLLDLLIEKKLVISLESQVAKLNSPNGRTPRFEDVSGNPKRAGVETVSQFSFPFK